jgi:hypothetical protein
MTTMIVELYEALMAAGVPEGKAKDAELRLLRKFGSPNGYAISRNA